MPNPPRTLSHNGEKKTLNEWATATGIPAGTIRARLDSLNYPVARALTTPVDKRFSRSSGRPRADAPRPCPPLKHHASGQAWCRWKANGQTHHRYFGAWGSAEAREGYKRFQVEWADGLATARSANRAGLSVAELIQAYSHHADRYYQKDGKPTNELKVIRTALRELRQWCGSKLVRDVEAGDVEGLQSALASRRLARKTVNEYIGRVKRLFAWGNAKKDTERRRLVPADVLVEVRSVRELQAYRSPAREPAPKRSVPWAAVEATMKHLSPRKERRAVLADAIRVQWLAGMRPGEVLKMRPADLDRTGGEWRYSVPAGGKTAHIGKPVTYWLGPKAQRIVSKYLDACPDDRPVFAIPPRSEGGRWVSVSVRRYHLAVQRACKLAKVKHWHPHQIRHSRATEVGQLYESDKAAAAAIGDTEDVTREIYRDPAEAARRRIARLLG